MTGSGIDWDDAFDNSGYAPGSAALREAWVIAAERTRTAAIAAGTATLGLPYGPGPRQALDLFLPQGDAQGTVIFVHGGYWHMSDRANWSHLSAGCLAHGWAVAMPSYPLAPAARISEITTSVRDAVIRIAQERSGQIRLVGHSAGGHLVSRMVCEGMLPPDVAARLARVVSISGVHHLMPLLQTRMNDTLQLTQTEAADESPISHEPLPHVPVTFWTGTAERPEFLRQARVAAEVWGLAGANVDTVFDAGHDHFTVVSALEDPDSALTHAVLR